MKNYYFVESPIHGLDLITSLSPLTILMAKQTSKEMLKKITEQFGEERDKLLQSLPQINKTRSQYRLNYQISSVMLAQHDLDEENRIAPSEIINSIINMVYSWSSLKGMTEEEMLDIPLENGYWVIELSSLIDPLFRKYSFSNEQMVMVAQELADGFNKVVTFSKEKSIASESRTKNSMSYDMGLRMKASLQSALAGTEQVTDELLNSALLEFRKVNESYSNTVQLFQRKAE